MEHNPKLVLSCTGNGEEQSFEQKLKAAGGILQPTRENIYGSSSATLSTNTQSRKAAVKTLSDLPVFKAPVGPPAQPRKKKAPALLAEDWEPYKDHILELYIDKSIPLFKILEIIKAKYGFSASGRQYKFRLEEWMYGNRKHAPMRGLSGNYLEIEKLPFYASTQDILDYFGVTKDGESKAKTSQMQRKARMRLSRSIKGPKNTELSLD